jgi:hypothetical protein
MSAVSARAKDIIAKHLGIDRDRVTEDALKPDRTLATNRPRLNHLAVSCNDKKLA